MVVRYNKMEDMPGIATCPVRQTVQARPRRNTASSYSSLRLERAILLALVAGEAQTGWRLERQPRAYDPRLAAWRGYADVA